MTDSHDSENKIIPTEKSSEVTTSPEVNPPLNREQRRAQAKGKKSSNSSFSSGNNNASSHVTGHSAHGPGTAGGVRLPRRSGGK